MHDALGRKYPNAGKNWNWQFAFPSSRLSLDREAGILRRFHCSPATLQLAVQLDDSFRPSSAESVGDVRLG